MEAKPHSCRGGADPADVKDFPMSIQFLDGIRGREDSERESSNPTRTMALGLTGGLRREDRLMRPEEIHEKLSFSGDRTVQVTIPAEVAFDLTRFQKVQKDILGRLGCMACCSGWDIRFDLQRRFVVDAKLNVREDIAGP